MREKKRKLYLDLSRKARGEIYTRAKNDIRRYGGIFTTHDYIGEDARASWADFVFLSRKAKIVYAGYIRIAQDALAEKAQEAASPEITEAFIKAALEFPKGECVKRDALGKPLCYKMDFSPFREPREEFGGLSYDEYYDSLILKEMAKKPPIYEEYEIDETFTWALGVSMIVDEPLITRPVIEKHIKRFWENGERNWRKDAPVDPEKLVYSLDWREKLGLSMSNALVNLDGSPVCRENP